MQLTGVPQVVAPLATGHPLGLPGAPVRTAEETKVQPVKEQSTTDTDHATDHGTEGQPPAGFWRSLTGLPDPANHVAPPSIMQIRISALLEEQAEALLKELRDKAIARMAAGTPAPTLIDSDAPRPAEEARATRPGGEQGIGAAEKTAAGAPPAPPSRPAETGASAGAPPSEPWGPDPRPVARDRSEPEMPAIELAERGYGGDSTSNTPVESPSFETHSEG